MSDNEILSDEELAALKEKAQRGTDSFIGGIRRYQPYFDSESVLALIARLERAEQKNEELRERMNRYGQYRTELETFRDEALKCLAEAPPVVRGSNGNPMANAYSGDIEAYWNWYTSDLRQNLLKGVK